MNNNTDMLHPKKELPKNYSRTFLDRCHEKARELGLRPSTIYKMAFLDYFNESTFTRIWNNTQDEPRIELEVAVRLCRVLGLSLSETLGIDLPPIDHPITSLIKKTDAEITKNTGEILAERHEEIEGLKAEIELLKSEVKSKSETLQTIHADYNRRIDALYAELKSCRDKLDESNQKLIDKTEKRSDKLEEFLEAFIKQNQ